MEREPDRQGEAEAQHDEALEDLEMSQDAADQVKGGQGREGGEDEEETVQA
jgi:hypothetical protein